MSSFLDSFQLHQLAAEASKPPTAVIKHDDGHMRNTLEQQPTLQSSIDGGSVGLSITNSGTMAQTQSGNFDVPKDEFMFGDSKTWGKAAVAAHSNNDENPPSLNDMLNEVLESASNASSGNGTQPSSILSPNIVAVGSHNTSPPLTSQVLPMPVVTTVAATNSPKQCAQPPPPPPVNVVDCGSSSSGSMGVTPTHKPGGGPLSMLASPGNTAHPPQAVLSFTQQQQQHQAPTPPPFATPSAPNAPLVMTPPAVQQPVEFVLLDTLQRIGRSGAPPLSRVPAVLQQRTPQQQQQQQIIQYTPPQQQHQPQPQYQVQPQQQPPHVHIVAQPHLQQPPPQFHQHTTSTGCMPPPPAYPGRF